MLLPSVIVLFSESRIFDKTNTSEVQKTNEAVLGKTASLSKPELSGWIAWWREDDGYGVVNRNKQYLTKISPGWFNLDQTQNLVEIGTLDKLEISANAKKDGLKLYPMIVTDLSDQQLSNFIRNSFLVEKFIDDLMVKAKYYQIDGVDLDFENIGTEYSFEFSYFIEKLGGALKKNNLFFSVTVQAQTSSDDMLNHNGQNISHIEKYADEIRVMIYDNHTELTEPGAISPMNWFKDVIDYNLKLVPKEKLIIGLPTYGYLWFNDGTFKSFQHNEFIEFVQNNNYVSVQDPITGETKYVSNVSQGWLSDSNSVIKKIKYSRSLGLNRFVIWNLSGTDEKLFNYQWD